MGNYIRTISDRATVVASDHLWLEDSAIQQLTNTSLLPGMRRVAGLPDLHPGRGYPVGAAFFSTGRLYPALCGGDIGCGVALWDTGLIAGKTSLDKLDKQLGNLDDPPDGSELARLAALDPELEQGLDALSQQLSAADLPPPCMASLGTIGLGNHFVELQAVDHVADTEAAAAMGLQPKRLHLAVHSGSRGLGQIVLRRHVELHSHAGLAEASPDAHAYLAQHAAALTYAHVNRRMIALRVLARLRTQGVSLLDVDHNYVAPAVINGEQGWLHRKGANPSGHGVVLLPGSRDAWSYVVQPLAADGDPGLQSLAHGAGRKWMRTDCKDRLVRRATSAQLARTSFGGRVICADKALIYEEAPQAYKDVDTVLDSLEGAGLARAIARLRPVLTYKTRGECC
ncbi:RNA ligase RtcB family protein [Pseudoduganella ginsengisoli]|uniref:3'-phosphate/5'-hydroxy nucleic acid ligase n=1 Tax=Pseudoduganella ginsengisoli TaxID=1462440 RepID=A0A6L6Q718_9BURK|nr:RNA ligase RtcB family protein [Pseudoduganella ginsengisoli]MTW05395.1 RNA ligase RtcB family protein [Pseudoduganella ginsengisoli]